MVKFTTDQLHEIMKKPTNIRNMSVIAHIDHGKTTLSDSLLSKAGIISQADSGKKRMMDDDKEEQERGITIKSSGVSLYYEYDNYGTSEPEPHIVNLIDSPGHIDFSSEVTAALRVTDGALVVVDYIEGVAVQTETVLRQALAELIKPVVVINKVDRAIFEKNHDGEEMYQNFNRVIESVNIVIDNYESDEFGSFQVEAAEGKVAFTSGYQGWGFTLNTFANIYAKKFGIPHDKIRSKLWGDNFFNPETKKWSTEAGDGFERGFCHFISKPMLDLAAACLDGNNETIDLFLANFNLTLNKETRASLAGKKLFGYIMTRWINCADALLDMIVNKLPSPVEAQAYRTDLLYTGPKDDACYNAMVKCDPDGPLMMFVSKMIPSGKGGNFYAFGRVFSGTVTAGAKVKIMGPNYDSESNTDVFYKNLQKAVIMMGSKVSQIESVPCGNTCALVGIDTCLVKQGTVSSDKDSYPIKAMKYSVSPVVQVSVKPKNPSELPKLIEGLKKMVKSDPLVQVIMNENENVVCASGELHIEVLLNKLQSEFANIEIIRGNPVVPYRETITYKSEVCFTKSVNKHNKLMCFAEPMDEEIVKAFESDRLAGVNELKAITKELVDNFDWTVAEARKIWKFGPDTEKTNMILDSSQGVMYLNEIRDSLVNSFQQATRQGPLAEEIVRGVQFNVVDATIHSDSVHRGGGQIIPASRRNYYACMLSAQPRLEEPIFLVDITAPRTVTSGVYECLSGRRGYVFDESGIEGTPLVEMKAYLPVNESFGFAENLRELTQGKAFPQCTFDHWELMNDNPLEENSITNRIAIDIRKRKGLKLTIDKIADLVDKQ